MKSYGKIVEFDGYSGMIIGYDGNNYKFLNFDLVDKNIKTGDYVSFDKDLYTNIELTRYMARFVKKIAVDYIKQQI